MPIDPKSTITGRMGGGARRLSQRVVVDVHLEPIQVILNYTTGVPADDQILLTAKIKALKTARVQLNQLKASIVERDP